MIRLCNCIFFFCVFMGCKSQTNNEKIRSTSDKVIKSIQEGDSKRIISLIALDDLGVIGKDEEMIAFDVKKYKQLLERYSKKQPAIEITELYNHLGQKLVKIPIYSKADTSARIKDL